MLLTHESKVELDYISLINMGIHVPEIGSAILINDEENAEKVAKKLLDSGYFYSHKELKARYRGQWKKKMCDPKNVKGEGIILIDESIKMIIDWQSLALSEHNIKAIEHFFMCVDDYLYLESDSGELVDDDYRNYFKTEKLNAPKFNSVYECWEWQNETQMKYNYYKYCQ